MENLYLLSELVKQLEEEKIVLNGELASLQKKQAEIAGDQKAISNQVSAKKAEATSITKEGIEKYKALWKSLGSNNAPPCPRCFIIHGKHSDLQAFPKKLNEDHFRCDKCNKWFHVPLP